jgi:tetratricopeptide (TPR) repeat protein
VEHILSELDGDADGWPIADRLFAQGQLFRVRRYCDGRDLRRAYLDRGRQVSDAARGRVTPASDVQLLLSLGQAAYALREFDLAERYFQQVLDHAFQGAPNYLASAHSNIAMVLYSDGDWTGATERLQDALAISRTDGGSPETVAAMLSNLGSAYGKIGKPREGIAHLIEGLQAIANGERPELEGPMFNQLGGLYLDVGEPALAEEAYDRALQLKRMLGDRPGEATTMSNLALVSVSWPTPPGDRIA